MKSDAVIKQDVEAELRWEPQVDETDIAVKVNEAAVTLSGYVRSFLEKHQAEQAVKRVGGVLAVANDLQVRLSNVARSSDPEIARAAIAALKSELPAGWDGIQVLIDNGNVRLEGKVEWFYQRERAETVVRRLNGVISLRNHLSIVPAIRPFEIKAKIEQAFKRSAEIDAEHVTVETNGSEVTLRGDVRSWSERNEAYQSAWSAPGVTNVINDLNVRPWS